MATPRSTEHTHMLQPLPQSSDLSPSVMNTAQQCLSEPGLICEVLLWLTFLFVSQGYKTKATTHTAILPSFLFSSMSVENFFQPAFSFFNFSGFCKNLDENFIDS
jgi:hypothetical protein